MTIRHIIHMTTGQVETLAQLEKAGNPAIRKLNTDGDILALDHTHGVFTEHYLWTNGSMKSYIQYGIDEWEVLPEGWTDIPREQLHEELELD